MKRANEYPRFGAVDSLARLEQALDHADFSAARNITGELNTPEHLDNTLALLARSAKSEPQAIELLVEVLDASGLVRRFAGAALLNHAAVDDVSQDALISVAHSIGSYDGRSKVSTWVHSIVRRRVVDHLRRERSTVPLDDGDLSPAARMSSIIATRATVRDALQALPEIYRAPVILRDIEGHSYLEIADRLDRAQGTIKAQIARGRAMVAARLSDDGAAV